MANASLRAAMMASHSTPRLAAVSTSSATSSTGDLLARLLGSAIPRTDPSLSFFPSGAVGASCSESLLNSVTQACEEGVCTPLRCKAGFSREGNECSNRFAADPENW